MSSYVYCLAVYFFSISIKRLTERDACYTILPKFVKWNISSLNSVSINTFSTVSCIILDRIVFSLQPVSHMHTQPFYGPFSGTTQVGRYQKRHSPTHTWNMWESVIILDFTRCGEDNRGKCTDSLAGRHPVQTIDAPTSIIPPILRRIPFLPQPSQFILAWDRHQICWIA